MRKFAGSRPFAAARRNLAVRSHSLREFAASEVAKAEAVSMDTSGSGGAAAAREARLPLTTSVHDLQHDLQRRAPRHQTAKQAPSSAAPRWAVSEDDGSSAVASPAGSVLGPVQLEARYAAQGAAAAAAEGAPAPADGAVNQCLGFCEAGDDAERSISLDEMDESVLHGGSAKVEVRAVDEARKEEAEAAKELEEAAAETTIGSTKAVEDGITDDLWEGGTSNGKTKLAEDILSTVAENVGVRASDKILGTADDSVRAVAAAGVHDPHEEADAARDKSRGVLARLAALLTQHTDFCAEARRQEWLEDARNLAETSAPQTVFGVLGNTGV
jgi:hypothetical protein